MRPLVKLILPEKDEVFMYTIIALGVLLMSNASRLWGLLYDGATLETLIQSNDVSWQVQSYLYMLEGYIDPRFVDFTAWMIIGIISVITVLLAQRVIVDTTQEIEVSRHMPTAQLKAEASRDVVLKIVVRLAGLVMLFIWLRLFIGAVYNQLSQLFFESVASLPDTYAIIAIPYAVLLTAVGLYTITICLRLIALKTRILL